MSEIAFVGLGNMGGPMAGNLVKAGHRVRGFDLSEDCRNAASANGLTIGSSLAECVAGADIVLTMLPAGRHVVSVWSEFLDLVGHGTLLIDCSTIDVDSTRNLHALATAKGCASLDAPVSGGIGGAAAATLTFMVGGSEDAFQKGRPVLEAMGGRIVHCGAGGAGQAAKICNNMILGVTMAALGEAFALGERLGLAHQALFDVVSTSSGQCWSVNTYCPVPGPVPSSPANFDYKPGFASALMLKDLGLSQEAARSSGSHTPLGAQAQSLYRSFNESGHSGEDFSAIIKIFQDRSNQG